MVKVQSVNSSVLCKIFSVLPGRYRRAYDNLKNEERQKVTEIRIRENRPCSFTLSEKTVIMTDNYGEIIKSTSREIEEIVLSLCGGSLYNFTEQIKCGYIPFYGTRVGVSGDGFYEGKEYKGFLRITSLNIRIPRFFLDTAREFSEFVFKEGIENTLGVLVISPPGLGKTTFLRSLAMNMSRLQDGKRAAKRVCLVDEREELYNKTYFESCVCDVISGVEKVQGIEMATRSMSPEIIVCDEIGNEQETKLLKHASNCGCYIAASVHGRSLEDVMRKKHFRNLFRDGIFKTAYILNRENENVIGKTIFIKDDIENIYRC